MERIYQLYKRRKRGFKFKYCLRIPNKNDKIAISNLEVFCARNKINLERIIESENNLVYIIRENATDINSFKKILNGYLMLDQESSKHFTDYDGKRKERLVLASDSYYISKRNQGEIPRNRL